MNQSAAMTSATRSVVSIDDLDADDPASVSVRAALTYTPTIAESMWLGTDEAGVPDQAALDWLLGHGVAMEDVASPIAIRTARVRFDGCGRYAPALIGDLAFILPVVDAGGLVDLAAWAPCTGQIGTRLAVGALLGGEQVGRSRSGDGVTFAPIYVHRSPLGWLRSRREGVVILDPSRAAVMLSGVNIIAEAPDQANDLRKVLRLPPPIIRRAERVAV